MLKKLKKIIRLFEYTKMSKKKQIFIKNKKRKLKNIINNL
jgi:hypothetical protein